MGGGRYGLPAREVRSQELYFYSELFSVSFKRLVCCFYAQKVHLVFSSASLRWGVDTSWHSMLKEDEVRKNGRFECLVKALVIMHLLSE